METFLTDYGYWALFLILIGGSFGLPVFEEIPLLLAGFLAHDHTLNLPAAMGTCLAGVVGGDFLIFLLGWRVGHGRGGTGPMGRVLTAERVERARRYFAQYGYLTVIFCRFLPGIRTPTFFAAGMTGIPMGKFMFYDFLSAMASVSVFCSLGFVFADQIERILAHVERAEHWLVAAVILATVVAAVIVAVRWQKAGGKGGGAEDGAP